MRFQHIIKMLRRFVGDIRTWYALCIALFVILIGSFILKEHLLTAYREGESPTITDRHGRIIEQYPNQKGHYAELLTTLPDEVADVLIQKEDRFFRYHFGINPVSTTRALLRVMVGRDPGASSTITQQLAKILLGTEAERTVTNKVRELFYTLALEMHFTKDEILTMYANSVYLGNQSQGFAQASRVYFDKEVGELNGAEVLELLASLSSPSVRNPWRAEANAAAVAVLADRLSLAETAQATQREDHQFHAKSAFEVRTLGISCAEGCSTTLDLTLNEKIRDIVARHVATQRYRGVRNGAVVVIKVPENEVVALVGSPDPLSSASGLQINMAITPRPIGSTAKPFIYLAGFEKGLRPYTTVEDREYKYPVATGFPLYPQNYDGAYRGEVTLHEALSNSLNVPTVKVLEYVGLDSFYRFLDERLGFLPIQEYDNYQYGIALGGLEMDALTLTHLFTIFPKEGILAPLHILFDPAHEEGTMLPPQARITEESRVAPAEYVELVNMILSDRQRGVAQFGSRSNLNLTQANYAVKTGTSRDFHDSWVVGYTPDFVVGVWIGNSENTPLSQVTGQTGAGAVWHDVMELLFTTEYNKRTPFAFDSLVDFYEAGTLEYGLFNDEYAHHRALLSGDMLILAPHAGDTIALSQETSIPLQAREWVAWYANGVPIGEGEEVRFQPRAVGTYEIEARGSSRRERIEIKLVEEI